MICRHDYVEVVDKNNPHCGRMGFVDRATFNMLVWLEGEDWFYAFRHEQLRLLNVLEIVAIEARGAIDLHAFDSWESA